METTEDITPEKVIELYTKYGNKAHFLACFGTTRFHAVDKKFLKRMYDFLVNKVGN